MYRKILLILFVLGVVQQIPAGQKGQVPAELFTARQWFHESVEDKSKIEPALDLFHEISKEYPELEFRVQVYLGALTAIQGKHAFWPHQKIRLVKRGLKMMDEAMEQANDDLEALFVYAVLNKNLPGIFGREEKADQAFLRLLKLLPTGYPNYDLSFISDMLVSLKNHLELSAQELADIENIEKELAKRKNEGINE